MLVLPFYGASCTAPTPAHTTTPPHSPWPVTTTRLEAVTVAFVGICKNARVVRCVNSVPRLVRGRCCRCLPAVVKELTLDAVLSVDPYTEMFSIALFGHIYHCN